MSHPDAQAKVRDLIAIGRSARAAGNIAGALRAFDDAIRQAPSSFAAVHGAIWTLCLAGDPMRNRRYIERLIPRFDPVERHLYTQALRHWNQIAVARILLDYWRRIKKNEELLAYKEEFSDTVGRSLTLDYISDKAVIDHTADDEAQALLDRRCVELGSGLAQHLPDNGIRPLLSDLDDTSLDRIVGIYHSMIEEVRSLRDTPWAGNRRGAFGRAIKLDRELLRAALQLGASGPELGIMLGDWRPYPVVDRRSGDVLNDFAYAGTPEAIIPEFPPPVRNRARLYNQTIVRMLIDRFGAKRTAAGLLELGTQQVAMPDHTEILLRLPDGAGVRSSTRDLVMYERKLWIEDALASLVERGVLPSANRLTVVEIGGGYGHLIRNMLLSGIAERAVLIDRPPNLAIAKRYLWPHLLDEPLVFGTEETSQPSPLVLLPPWHTASFNAEVDVAVNFISFQHMPLSVVEFYGNLLGRLGTRVVIHENRRHNIEPDHVSLINSPLRRNYVPIHQETRIYAPVEIVREVLVRRDLLPEADQRD